MKKSASQKKAHPQATRKEARSASMIITIAPETAVRPNQVKLEKKNERKNQL